MDPQLLDDFDDAQRRGFALLSELVRSLESGMAESDIDATARDLARKHGFSRWFHPPEILVGGHTTSNAVWKLPSRKRVLEPGQLVVIDLGPGDERVYADVGTTVAFGVENPPLLHVARECCRATMGYGSQWKTVGELFVYAKAWATNNRLTLASTRSIGHAILPRGPMLAWNYPRSAHAATWLRRNQIRFLNPLRLQGLWAVRPLISDGAQAASFEEVLYVHGDEKRILGRDSLDEVGTLPGVSPEAPRK